MNDCIFCEIIKGNIPSVMLYEDEKCVVMMDKFPASKGQCLVIPKEHQSYIFDIDDKLYQHLFEIAKKVAKAIDKSLNTVRTCVVIEGFEVPHVHIRIHPCYENKLVISGGKEATIKELETVASQIEEVLTN